VDVLREHLSVPGESVGVVGEQYRLIPCRRRLVVTVQHQRCVECRVLDQQTAGGVTLHRHADEQLQQTGGPIYKISYDLS